MARYLLPPSHLVNVSRVSSATSERGAAIRLGPVADAGNTGTLKLWAEHIDPDVTPVALALIMESAGNPEGYIAGGPTAAAGARLRWKLNGQADSLYRNYVDRPFCEFLDRPAYNDGSNSYGRPSHLRTCHNGTVGFATYNTGGTSDELVYRYKTDSRDSWTSVSIHGGGASPSPVLTSVTGQPGLLITDAGRLIVYARILSPYAGASGSYLGAWKSDDNGLNWSLLNTSAAALFTTHSIINAEWVSGAAMLICGSVSAGGTYCYNSTSDGIAFTLSGTGGTYYRPRTTVVSGVVMVHADDNGGGVFQQTVSPGGNVDDDNAWVELTTVGSGSTNKERALITDDQGDLWLATVLNDTNAQTLLYYSSNAGSTWVQAGQNTTGTAVVGLDLNNLGTSQTWQGLSGGMMGGSLVLLGRTDGNPSANDGNILAAYLGGWNLDFSEQVFSEYAGDSYALHYLPFADPVSFGWTKVDTLLGGTVVMSSTGWKITGTSTGATEYTAPANWITSMSNGNQVGARIRAITNHTNTVAGSTTDSRCRIRLQKNVTGGAQWVELRFSRDRISAYDSTGQIGTVGGLANQFVGSFEYVIDFQGLSGGTGTCTIYYRKVSDGAAVAWSTLIDAAAITTDATASGDQVIIGGNDTAGESDMSFLWLALATDGYGIDAAAPLGRALSNSGVMYLDAGLAVGGYGTGAVAGDTYALSQVTAFPKESIWTNPSPGEQCQSIDATSLWRVIFDAGPNGRWRPDMIQLFGTNFKDALVEFNATDSWGSPSYSTAISATIRADSIDSAELGGVALDLLPAVEMVPHEFASKPGHKYYVHFGGTNNVYEITDNSPTFLFVESFDLSSETGTASVFGGSMWAALPNSDRRYMSITVAAQKTASSYFTLGYVLPGLKVSMNAGDGSDAAWGWSRGTKIPVRVEKAADGYSSPTLLGGPQKMLMLPMLPSLSALRDWHGEVAALHRYIDGPGGVMGVVLNSAVSHMHNNGGLFRLVGDTVRQVNVYGESDTLERVRVTALNMEEVI
jgi:hypothetical protein